MTELEKNERNNLERLNENLRELDQILFPEKPLPIKQNEFMKVPAMHHFDKDSQGNLTNHYYATRNYLLDEENEIALFGIASHEVRHRVQHEKLNEIFTEKNLDLVDKIEYEPLKKYSQESNMEISKSIKNIIQNIEDEKGKKLSRNDYDAVVVETLARFLRREGLSTSEIALFLISKEPRQIKEGFKMIKKT